MVLVKDVERLGAQGTVVRVKPGFARNYLLPRGLAVAATPQALQTFDAAKRRRVIALRLLEHDLAGDNSHKSLIYM